MSIPIVIFHTGGSQDYFNNCVNVSSENNTVYVISDDSNKTTFSSNPKVRFFHVDDLQSSAVEEFKTCFINYSGNPHDYEMYCFLRVFYLKTLFEKTGLEWAFHTDSDCVILDDINAIFCSPDKLQIAYSIQKTQNQFHMAGSIHNALLNVEFCDAFIQLCFDIYKNKSKFALIDAKMQWHKNNGVPGGICDMTLYYLLYSEKLIDNICDLNIPIMVDGERAIFDHNLSDTYGFNGEETYTRELGMKVISRFGKKFYFNTQSGDPVRTISIHFQGTSAKRILSEFSI
jgi:hypothetical protein